MSIEISINSLASAEEKLRSVSKAALQQSQISAKSQLSEAFSQIPGLGFLAAEHGRTLAGNPGSAAEEFSALANKIAWAADNLHTLADAVYEQDDQIARSLDNMHGAQAATNEHFFTAAEPDDKTAPVAINSPVIGYVPDIDLLASYFSGTVDSAAHHDAELWQHIGQTATEISDGLEEVAAELESNNYGDAISGGAHKLRRFANTGRVLNANSQIMNGTIQNLVQVIDGARQTTNLVQQSLRVNQHPGASAAIEQSYLTSFPPQFAAALQGAVPRLLGLSIPQPNASGGDNQAVEGGHAQSGAEQARAAMRLPTDVQQAIADYGSNQATFAAADEGTASVANVGTHAAHATAAGHHPAPHTSSANLASQPAATTALNAQHPGIANAVNAATGSPANLPRGYSGLSGMSPATTAPGAGASRVLGAGSPAGLGPSRTGGAAIPNASTVNTANSRGGGHAVSRPVTPAPGSAPLTARGAQASSPTNGGTTIGRTPGIASGHAGTGFGGTGVPGINGTGRSGINATSPLGIGARGVGTTGLSNPGSLNAHQSENFSARPIGAGGTAPHSGGSSQSGGTSTNNGYGGHGSNGGNNASSNNGAHNSSGQHGSNGHHGNQQAHGSNSGNSTGNSSRAGTGHLGRGMTPMMGTPGQGGQGANSGSKPNRAKAVTTAIEREGNQKALLGERRPVVPGVIGAWVRD